MSGKYALIIGNTEYIDPGLAQLTAPGKDAEDFARVLKEKDLGAFDLVNVLVNEPSSTVIEAIDEFFDHKKPDDLLVLYFSGHGVKDQLGSLYLAFKNTIRSRLRATAIKSDYISEAMDQSRSKRQVLILDCCNSGAFPPGTKSEVGGAMGMTRAFQGYGRFVLTASNAIQFAFEGDRFIGEAQNSLLTHFLIKGLEGEADINSDGSITVDELYDYAYEQISRITPEQTPTKSASKQEGEIILRQNMRIEDIKPVSLPDDLIGDIDDLRPLVREGAVQRLEKILRGKNIGMARSAIEALEKVAADENTTRRVSQLAMQILESYLQAEKKVEEERKAREEAERLAALKAEEERLARETAEAERKAKEEAEKLARAQADREAAEREASRLRAEREATELAAREAVEKAAREKTEKEAAEREAARLEAERKAAREKAEHEDAQKAEHDAMELASRRKAEREAAEKAEREAIQLAARRKAEREAADKGVVAAGKTAELQSVLQQVPILKWGIIGIIGLCIIATGAWGIPYLARLINPPATPAATESPMTQPPAAIGIPAGAAYECTDALGCVTITPDEPVHIAYWGVLSGPDSSLGEDSKRGVEIAIDDKGGKFLDHDILLTTEDAGCSPEGGATAAAKLATDKSIVGLIGSNCSDETIGGIATLTQAGLTTISPSNTRPVLTDPNRGPDYAGYLRISHSDAYQGNVVAEFAYNELGARKAATLHDGSAYAEALQQVFADNFTALGGEIVAQEAVARDATDMKPVLTTIAAAEPEFLYYPVFVAVGGYVTAQVRNVAGLEDVVLAGSDGTFTADLLNAAGPNVEGMYLSSPDFSLFTGDYAGFIAKHQTKYGSSTLSIFHAHAYDAANILFAALEKVAIVANDGTIYIPRQALRDAIYATKDFKGITGTLSCTPFGDCSAPVIAVYQVVNTDPASWNPADPTNPNPKKVYP